MTFVKAGSLQSTLSGKSQIPDEVEDGILFEDKISKNKFKTILRRFSDRSDYQELLSPVGVRL